jgi:predicted aspartyl protease
VIFPFDLKEGVIIVPARLTAPKHEMVARLILDTGATYSAISRNAAAFLGIEPTGNEKRVRLITASSAEYVPKVVLKKINVLEHERRNFPALCHALPPSITAIGVLGLDFLRQLRLTIDFRSGLLTID